MTDLNMLLSCFRTKMSELDPWSLVEAREQQRRKVSAAAAAVGEIGD